VKLLFSMKIWISDSYCCVGNMTIVLTFSSRVIIAPFCGKLLGLDLIV